MNEQFERLITGYMEHQLGISNGFLTEELSIALQKNIITLAKQDKLRQAGIGNNSKLAFAPNFRKDKIFWLDKEKNNAFEKAFFLQIENFVEYLNSTCYTGITNYEFHYALYEPGSFYKKHKDQFKDNDKREFSIITYLNENWQADDGGELIVYKKDGQEKITPTIGKTVFFKSNELAHEVLASNTNRLSITGWLKCR